jgi:zinc transporter ZupT
MTIIINNSSGRSFSPILVLCALSIHSIMETTTLGLQSSKKSALLLASSIGVHQPAESLTMLISLLKSGLSRRNIALLLGAYSLVGPLGLASGLFASVCVSNRFLVFFFFLISMKRDKNLCMYVLFLKKMKKSIHRNIFVHMLSSSIYGILFFFYFFILFSSLIDFF